MTDPKVFIGPMTKNVIDAAIALHDEYPIAFIPSRRQIDYNGGYVGFTTEEFRRYVPLNIIIQRDHGGPLQGSVDDDGIESLKRDAISMPAIHIDPWKAYPGYVEGIEKTIELINVVESLNLPVSYEIGTEEAIRPISRNEFDSMFHWLKMHLPAWSAIKYVVVQSGVALDLPNQTNVGTFNPDRLKSQLTIAKYRGIKTKEHNGDYLLVTEIHERFRMGLDAINIAPEFGQYETQAYLELMDKYQEEEFYIRCLDSPYWKKWVGSDFDPNTQKRKLMLTTGHYIIPSLSFRLPVYDYVKDKMKNRLESIYAA